MNGTILRRNDSASKETVRRKILGVTEGPGSQEPPKGHGQSFGDIPCFLITALFSWCHLFLVLVPRFLSRKCPQASFPPAINLQGQEGRAQCCHSLRSPVSPGSACLEVPPLARSCPRLFLCASASSSRGDPSRLRQHRGKGGLSSATCLEGGCRSPWEQRLGS